MEPVRGFVSRLILTDRYGGRFIQRDEETLILYDVPSWGEDQTAAVRGRFPECDISMQAHSGSLSGFIVVIRSHSGRGAWLWATTLGLAMIGAAYSCMSIQRGYGGLA